MSRTIAIDFKSHPHLFDRCADGSPCWSQDLRPWLIKETPGAHVTGSPGWCEITFKTPEDGVKFAMFML